jgi:CRP/FNR family transcriptional activator FtrB
MRDDEIAEIRNLAFFQQCDSGMVGDVLRVSYLQKFPARVELVREGEPADFLHLIVDGRVEVYSAYRDRETTFSIHGPGHAFIIAAVILDRVYLKSTRTLVPSRILLLPADAVRRCFAKDAAFARRLATEMAIDYRGVVKELKNQKLRSGLERLANWLIVRDKQTGTTGRFDIPFDKKILAAHLGMAPEVLSRSFGALGAYKVYVNGPEIEIRDREALLKLARPTPTFDDPEA